MSRGATGPSAICDTSSVSTSQPSGHFDDSSSNEDHPELSTILLQGEDIIGQLAAAHAKWGLGTADRWDLDQPTGVITWTFPDRTASADAQLLGTHNPSSGTWQWAWANASIAAELSRDSLDVKAWAERAGHQSLTLPELPADEELAATLAAIAVRVTHATGFYRASTPSSTLFLTFGPVQITPATGEATTFRITID